jgi:hypothetical protein
MLTALLVLVFFCMNLALLGIFGFAGGFIASLGVGGLAAVFLLLAMKVASHVPSED